MAVKVRALEKGFYNDNIVHEGDEFTFEDGEVVPDWVEVIEDGSSNKKKKAATSDSSDVM